VKDLLDRPIIVVGTHRSCTSLLGRILSHHEDVAYMNEPRHIWTRGMSYRRDDVLTRADASARVKGRIRKEFEDFVREQGKSRFAEKTPSNCLRLPFVDEVLPGALYIHIYRDGRGVVNSTMDMLARKPDAHWYAKRAKGTPIWEWPAYIPKAIRTVGRRVLKGRMSFWGPRPSGWQSWVKNDPEHVRLARQWAGIVESVLAFRETVDRARWFEISHEAFVREPESWVSRVLDFAQLPPSPRAMEFTRATVQPARAERWKSSLDAKTLQDIRPILEPTMTKLGYEWSTSHDLSPV
jgi:hypothetical protein